MRSSDTSSGTLRGVPVDLRSLSRAGARMGAGRVLPLAALLGVIVVLTAGLGGPAHFSGARWYPHLGGGSHATALPKRRVGEIPPATTVGRRGHGSVSLPTWVVVVAIVVVVIAIVAFLLWLWSRRRAPAAPRLHPAGVQVAGQPVPAEPEPEPETLLTGIELALQVLDEGREPGDAIVRAWVGLQETAAESGIVRRPAEGPTEFTARIMAGAFADDRALRTLLRLYLRTRFGDHPVTAADVAAVRDALAQLVSSWRAPESATHAGTR